MQFRSITGNTPKSILSNFRTLEIFGIFYEKFMQKKWTIELNTCTKCAKFINASWHPTFGRKIWELIKRWRASYCRCYHDMQTWWYFWWIKLSVFFGRCSTSWNFSDSLAILAKSPTSWSPSDQSRDGPRFSSTVLRYYDVVLNCYDVVWVEIEKLEAWDPFHGRIISSINIGLQSVFIFTSCNVELWSIDSS